MAANANMTARTPFLFFAKLPNEIKYWIGFTATLETMFRTNKFPRLVFNSYVLWRIFLTMNAVFRLKKAY